MNTSSLRTGIALLGAVAAGFGQTAPAHPAFEVASIKPAPPMTPERMRSGQMHIGATIDKAQADFGGMPLRDLIARAWRVRVFQISGPDWMTPARFDIRAKMPEGATEDQVPEMLQALLMDRFKLTLHRDSKEFPVYALVVAKGGAKLTARPADYDPAVRSNIRPMTLESFANILSGMVDRPVVDQTELKGEYMLSMDVLMRGMLARVRARAEQAAANSGRGPSEAAADPDSSTFSAVQAMGLKLEPRKLSMPLLVIDHLEKTPTEN